MLKLNAEPVGPHKKRRSWLRRAIVLAIVVVIMMVAAAIGKQLLLPFAIHQIEEYTGTTVSVRSARLSFGGTLWLNDLRVMTNGSSPSLILEARKVSVKFDVLSVLKGTPELVRMTVTGGQLNAEYIADKQTWNLASLAGGRKMKSRAVGRLPQIEIIDSTVRLTSRNGETSKAILTVPLGFDAQTTTDGGYQFHMTSAITPPRVGAKADEWAMDIRGKVSDMAGAGDFSIEIAVNDLVLSNKRAVGRMTVGREMAEILHPELVDLWDKYGPDGVVDVQASLSGSLADISKGSVKAKFMFRDVSLTYKYFPYVLDHVKGNIIFENGDLVIEGLKGEHGRTQATIAGYSRGSGPKWDCDVKIHSDAFAIDDDVYKALTTSEKKIWFLFSPSGTSRLDYQYKGEDGKELLSRITLGLIDARMMYQHFPHQFRNITGTFVIDPNEVRLVDIVSRDEGSETKFSGQVTNTRSGRPDVVVKVAARGLPVGAKLLSECAGERYRSQVSDIDFAGKMDINLSVFSKQKPQWHIDYIADVNAVAQELRYVSKGMMLSDVSARASVTPARVSLHAASARYGDGRVDVSGQMDIVDDVNSPIRYRLAVDGNNINIDNGVLGFIPQKARSLLDEMQPSGRINVAARLNSYGEPNQDSVTIECLAATVGLKKMGYTLDNIIGTVAVRGGNIEFGDMHARAMEPGDEPGKVSLKGKGLVGKDKLEELDIRFEMENLQFGKGLRAVIERLSPGLYDPVNPSGRIDLKECSLKMGIDPRGLRYGTFVGRVAMRDCAFGKEEFSKINAVLDLNGSFERGSTLGDVKAGLRVDTMVIRDKLFTTLQSPVEYRKNTKTWSLSNFHGYCYDGQVAGDMLISSDESDKYTYSLKTKFDSVSMGKFLAKPGADPNTISNGVMKGLLVVKGLLGEKTNRTGTLKLSIVDMRAGKMSLMAKILTLLSFTVPGDVAFYGMDMDSQIKGEEMIVENLKMSGEALNFQGAGKINLTTRLVDIDLAATSPTPTPGFMTSVIVGIRHAVVYLKVRGQIDDPEVNVTPLPMIDKAVQKVLGTKE
jgi:hypothetical protein